MRPMEVKLNGVTRAFGRAILVGALLWTGQASAQFGPPGFGPPGGGDFRRDYDRGRDSDRSRDSDRDRDRDSSSRSSSSGSSSHQSTSTVTTPGHTRVTMGLQATYADVDTNHDGQLIMAEW